MTTPATPGFSVGSQMEKSVMDSAHIPCKQGKEEWQATRQTYHVHRKSGMEIQVKDPV